MVWVLFYGLNIVSWSGECFMVRILVIEQIGEAKGSFLYSINLRGWCMIIRMITSLIR